MKERKKKAEAKKASSKKTVSHKYETMSQAQNRHGKGRERNGSDGTAPVRGSNH